ncbi:MAG: Dihydrolipoyl dehydrogenase [Turneriella sp.]|nr:Dihydrolipoyl dehydrogenase [Turneriella sp.]
MQHFDYVVLGAGPGGYSSAIRAAQLGKKTAIVERENAGGICLNWGCIPTKALLNSAHLKLKLDKGKLGIQIQGDIGIDLKTIVERSRKIATRLQSGVKSLFKKYGVTLVEGEGRFTSNKELSVNTANGVEAISFENACIATGARARPLPSLPFSPKVWQYRDALIPQKLPTTLTIVGGGAIGLEFADFYHSLGSKVTLVEMAPHILPLDDAKVATHLKKALEARGMRILENTQIIGTHENTSGVETTVKTPDGKEEKILSEVLLAAIGVVPNTENIGVDKFSILDSKNFIQIDKDCRTKEKNIFAIGDVTQGKLLAHRAAHQGIYVAEFISGKNPAPIPEIPACIYTSPQVATIGVTEKELKDKKHEYLTGEFPWLASGMALAAGEENAFTRVFADKKTGAILGAQIVGENAAELIGQVALAMGSELLAEDFLHAVFPHPTLSETVAEAFGVLTKSGVNF